MIDTTRRIFLAGLAPALTLRSQTHRDFDVLKFGAAGDGKTLDSAAIQKAIDEAAAAGEGSRVLLRGGRKYLVGTLVLKTGIEFNLADDAELIVSTNQADYPSGDENGVLTANGARDLKITGTGNIAGRATEFMTGFNEEGEIWRFGAFRPKMFILTGCQGLEVRGISFSQAPQWGLHMLGCEHVLVDGLRIRNNLDVPNCDGIDPDHCRDVEIRKCDIVCGDDAIVVKATRQNRAWGPSANITVKDCILETKDSGVKIGTETTEDIHHVRFQNCEIKSACRGLTIQLRDEGSVHDVEFENIRFVSRYQAAPWWGRGEAISFTAIPRAKDGKTGTIHDVRVRNVTGRAENSIRINGTPESRIRNITLDHVAVTFDRWTKYAGGVFDNRPTTAYPALEAHRTPGISVRYADGVRLVDCSVAWGEHCPPEFASALEIENSTTVERTRFTGSAAHPESDPAVVER
jgi:hypothetical protein